MNSTKNRESESYEMVLAFVILVICIFLSFIIEPDQIMEFIGINP